MAEVLGAMAVFYTALLRYSLSVSARDIIKKNKSYTEISQFIALLRFCCSTFVFIILLNPLKSSLDLFIFVRFIHLEE